MKIETPGLHALIRRAAAKNRTAKNLAELVGVSLSAMLRGSKNGHLSTDVLLGIAEYGGLDPTALLRTAGRAQTAARIERLYGRPKRGLSADERVLLSLDDAAKHQLCRLIDGLKGDA